jgi:hypothetical protein
MSAKIFFASGGTGGAHRTQKKNREKKYHRTAAFFQETLLSDLVARATEGGPTFFLIAEFSPKSINTQPASGAS